MAVHSHPVSFKLLFESVVWWIFLNSICWHKTHLLSNQGFDIFGTFGCSSSAVQEWAASQVMYCAWVKGYKSGQFKKKTFLLLGCGPHSNGRDEQLFYLVQWKQLKIREDRQEQPTPLAVIKITLYPTTPFLANFVTNFYSCDSCLGMPALKWVEALNFVRVWKF